MARARVHHVHALSTALFVSNCVAMARRVFDPASSCLASELAFKSVVTYFIATFRLLYRIVPHIRYIYMVIPTLIMRLKCHSFFDFPNFCLPRDLISKPLTLPAGHAGSVETCRRVPRHRSAVRGAAFDCVQVY